MGCPSASAPERSLAQRKSALKGANKVRSERAQIKRDLKAGRRQFHDLIMDPPNCILTMKVFDLVLELRKYGRVKTNSALIKCGISPVKTVGGLTDRQRNELVSLINPTPITSNKLQRSSN